MHLNKGKSLEQCLHDRTAYAMNPQKTNDKELIKSYECDPRTIENEFLVAKRQYAILTGRQQKNNIIAYQIRQSFKPGEITAEEANKVGYELAQRFLKGDYPFVVCTHTDKAHIHNHIIWSSTSNDCKRKFRNFFNSSFAIRRLSDLICTEHKLSVIENPKKKGKSYDTWLGRRKIISHREQLRISIDDAISKNPKSFEELLSLLESSGCEVKRHRNPAIRIGPEHRYARFDTLGPGYSAEELRAIIAGTKLSPARKRSANEKKSVNLLIDIQEKLQQGKGLGYERWAKSFNLKQKAETVLYLQKHNLLDYNDLSRKSDAVTDEFNILSAQIKDAEKRMAEIAVMKKHIINYVKTKDVYTAYRQAGYSKKYLAEHEPDILLHKAAKKYFDDAELKHLPTVKALNAEYAELLAKKKEIYTDYRRVREEMRELVVVKANVERILGIEKKEAAENDRQSYSRVENSRQT